MTCTDEEHLENNIYFTIKDLEQIAFQNPMSSVTCMKILVRLKNFLSQKAWSFLCGRTMRESHKLTRKAFSVLVRPFLIRWCISEIKYIYTTHTKCLSNRVNFKLAKKETMKKCVLPPWMLCANLFDRPQKNAEARATFCAHLNPCFQIFANSGLREYKETVQQKFLHLFLNEALSMLLTNWDHKLQPCLYFLLN